MVRDLFTLQSIKHSHSGLDYLLSNEDYDIDSAKPVVVYGGADGNTITLVINPLCNPCARKIRNLIPIIQSKRYTNLQVIFLTNLFSTREMSIATSLISSIMKGRRDDFKDYFDHYPAIHQHDYSFCLQDYMHLLQNQTEWCFAHGFTSTPLVFFNGKLLPSMYSVEDIDFITE